MQDCGLEVSDFELQSRYYVLFRIDIIGTVIFSTPCYELSSITSVLLQGFGIK